MFIVIEGPDGSGKSTLHSAVAQLAAERFPDREIVTFHMGRPEEETRQWCLKQWVTNIEKNDWHGSHVVISDRWHWGEVAYAPLKRPHTNKDGFGLLGIAGWRFVELMLLSRGVAQFVISQPTEVLAERVGTRGDDFVKIDELEQINRLYKFGIESSAHVGLIYPGKNSLDGVHAIADSIIADAVNREEQTAHLCKYKKYIGSARPAALLVGDKRSVDGETVLPFYPINGNSGEYLLSNLPEGFWKNIGIINGTEFSGEETSELWELLGRPKVVALGRMAEKSLKDSCISADQILVLPHPQYVRRFHHQDGAEYGRAIKSASEGRPDPSWILR